MVDNASTDGSAQMLQVMAGAGLCEVILNGEQRYHGWLQLALVRARRSTG